MEATEDLVHKPLKGLCSITEAEGHPTKLEQAKGSGNGCLLYVIWCHGNLMIRTDEINVRKNRRSLQCCSEVLYVWYRIPVRNCCIIEGPVIATGLLISRDLLCHHVEWGRPAARGRLDNTKLEHMFEFLSSDV